MPDTKCPICQPDLPATDIKICESCKIKLQLKPFVEEALINAYAKAVGDVVFSHIDNPKPNEISNKKIGIIGLNNSNAEIGIELARVMEGKHEVIIVNADIPIAKPTLPEMEPIFPITRYFKFEAPITRKERRKQKRKSK